MSKYNGIIILFVILLFLFINPAHSKEKINSSKFEYGVINNIVLNTKKDKIFKIIDYIEINNFNYFVGTTNIKVDLPDKSLSTEMILGSIEGTNIEIIKKNNILNNPKFIETNKNNLFVFGSNLTDLNKDGLNINFANCLVNIYSKKLDLISQNTIFKSNKIFCDFKKIININNNVFYCIEYSDIKKDTKKSIVLGKYDLNSQKNIWQSVLIEDKYKNYCGSLLFNNNSLQVVINTNMNKLDNKIFRKILNKTNNKIPGNINLIKPYILNIDLDGKLINFKKINLNLNKDDYLSQVIHADTHFYGILNSNIDKTYATSEIIKMNYDYEVIERFKVLSNFKIGFLSFYKDHLFFIGDTYNIIKSYDHEMLIGHINIKNANISIVKSLYNVDSFFAKIFSGKLKVVGNYRNSFNIKKNKSYIGGNLFNYLYSKIFTNIDNYKFKSFFYQKNLDTLL